MNKLKITPRVFAFVALAALLTASPIVDLAQAQDPSRKPLSEEEIMALPGYFDFQNLLRFSDGDEEIEVQLTQPLLGVMAPFLGSEDPQLAELVLDLHMVKVNAFSYRRSDTDELLGGMDGLAEDLRGKQWENIVKVRKSDERANVFVHFEGDGSDPANTFLSGLAILALEHDQAVLVNVVGRFRLEDIARIGQHFEFPEMEDLEEQIERYNTSDDEESEPRR
jgi:hypothetical protein